MKSTKDAIYQRWMESERGWGQRPDGYSLHLTSADLEQYIKDYWDSMPDRGPYGEAPDEYSFPEGSPRIIAVNLKQYRELQNAKKRGRVGIREWGSWLTF